MTIGVPHATADGMPDGILAFTTTRDAGTFGLSGSEPVGEVMGRWGALKGALAPHATRILSSPQIHGATVLVHDGSWAGWLRGDAADGHFTTTRGLAMAVTVADCTPVFLAHPSGAIAILHAGWRGTAGRIAEAGIQRFAGKGIEPRDVFAHLGPSICEKCYEVGPEVHLALTGRHVARRARVDVRGVLREQLQRAGVERISVSKFCTRCDNDRFFSHRAGDSGRQIGVIAFSADERRGL